MCLINVLMNDELKTLKKTLPKEFDVWKAVQKNGMAEYAQYGENELTIPGIHSAECKDRHRSQAPYGYGRHAFLSLGDAKRYIRKKVLENRDCLKIKRFRAKRRWIKAYGYTRDWKIPAIVLTKIEVLLEE